MVVPPPPTTKILGHGPPMWQPTGAIVIRDCTGVFGSCLSERNPLALDIDVRRIGRAACGHEAYDVAIKERVCAVSSIFGTSAGFWS